MLQLENNTPFRAGFAALADADGVDAVFVCVKATFSVARGLAIAIAAEQRAIAVVDRYRGEPGTSSLLEAGEHHLGKLGTDVVVSGHAYAPDERPCVHTAVSVAVAERKVVVSVHGDRRWRSGGRVSEAEPFTAMPLTYERALGGAYHGRDAHLRTVAAANPVGVGLDRSTGAPVPNLEDPAAPLDGGRGPAAVIGVGPVAPGWQPRLAYAGTYDARWARYRAPLLPTDLDRRYFNVAPGPLAFDRFLRGGEAVELIGLSRRGTLAFDLPQCALSVAGRIDGAWRSMPAQLETVALWPDDDLVSLSFRAKLSCDRQLLRVQSLRVDLAQTAGVAA